MNCQKCGGQYCSVDRCLPAAPKTLADHARAYRTRKAERIARMEAALRDIAACGHHEEDRKIASEALAKPTAQAAKNPLPTLHIET